MIRNPVIAAVVALGAAPLLVTLSRAQDGYRSPYSVEFSFPVAELLEDMRGPRGRIEDASATPISEWYSRRTLESTGAWGPRVRHFPPAEAVRDRPLAWQRERVIALALRYRGYGYQHHHIPDWDPPADWPWSKTAVGHNGKGVDCSNLTAFVYNLGFGLKPSSAIKRQAEELEIPGPGPERVTRAERIELPGTYAGLVETLCTGDLLFVRNRGGELAHVVLWVGAIGRAPNGTPLILDSHGEGVKDANGVSIPCGIHLRPFREDSWYYRSASHAHRILHERER